MDVPMRLAAATFRISERLARSLACGATGAAMMPPSMAGEGDACPRNHGARVPRWQPSRLPARADSCDFRCDAGVAGGRWPTLGPCRRCPMPVSPPSGAEGRGFESRLAHPPDDEVRTGEVGRLLTGGCAFRDRRVQHR